MDSLAPFTAANKFGLGLREGQLAEVAANPKRWLQDQLDAIAVVPTHFATVDSSAHYLQASYEALMAKRQEQVRQSSSSGLSDGSATDKSASIADPNAADELRRRFRRGVREIRAAQQSQFGARLGCAIDTDTPFGERLVRFWSNHFTVANKKINLQALCVPYENEAIRPNLNGHFEDLVLAVEQHPAMLIYLDNVQSIGENSSAGKRSDRGLNENLAREILELHTLGVDGGYQQSDVISLAKIITGWTIGRPGAEVNPRRKRLRNSRAAASTPGTFAFVPLLHEPGPQQLLGKRYADQGVVQGEKALTDLARHPATAQFIATKLVRHFVADQAPDRAVKTIAATFVKSRGHLPTVHKALIDLDEAWQGRYKKLKTPEEYVVSTLRALTPQPVGSSLLNTLNRSLQTLNQRPFSATSPAGWPDSAEHWGSPNALLQRIDWANEIGERWASQRQATELLTEIMPRDDTLQRLVMRAESNAQSLALVLASPNFQWR